MNAPLAASSLVPDFRARFTADEFIGMVATGAFDGMKVELLDGELERMTPPMSEHSRLQVNVVGEFYKLRLVDPLRIFGEIGIRLDDRTVVAADAAIAKPRDQADRMWEADEVVLAVEVASTTLPRDLGAKRAAYARAGVPHYWVIDAGGRLVHRFAEPADGDYHQLPAVRFGEPLPVPGIDRTIVIDWSD